MLKRSINNLLINQNLSPRKKKDQTDYFKLQKSQQSNKINEMMVELNDLEKKFNRLNLTINKITVLKRETSENEGKFNRQDLEILNYTKTDCASNKNEILFRISRSKELSYISDNSYDKFAKACDLGLPSLHEIRQYRYFLDKKQYLIHYNYHGVYVDPREKIYRTLQFLNNKLTIKSDNIIKIKLCGDSTRIGRTLKVLNFNFTVINEGAPALTAFGNYTLGVFQIQKEDNDSLSKSLSECSRMIKDLTDVNINGKICKIKYYLGGDMSFIAHAMGINAANSNKPCVWCVCPQSEFYNLEKQWSYSDTNLGARSLKESNLNSESKKLGYINKPIFDFIDFKYVVFDMLHMLLRIANKLVYLLIQQLKIFDFSISKNEVSNQMKFYDFLTSIHIRNPFYFDNKEILPRDLVGDEYLKLFSKIDIKELFEDTDDNSEMQIHSPYSKRSHSWEKNKISKLWKQFYTIYSNVKRCKYIEKSETLKTHTSEWMTLFLQCYHRNHVTPYIHFFSSHLYQIVDALGDVNAFNIQGLEKLNDITTQQYFKSTNKNNNYLEQIIKKRNRIEYFNFLVEERRIIRKQPKQLKEIGCDNRPWVEYHCKNVKILNFDCDILRNKEHLNIKLLETLLRFRSSNTNIMLDSDLLFNILVNGNCRNQIKLNENINCFYGVLREKNNEYALFYASVSEELVYYISTNESNIEDTNILYNWKKVMSENEQNALKNIKWTTGNFELTQEYESNNSAIVLVQAFQCLVQGCDYFESNQDLDAIRLLYYNEIKSTSIPLNQFCSSCGDQTNINTNTIKCSTCNRMIHHACLLFDSVTAFQCFFCQK